MVLKFTFPMPPFSINKAHYRNGNRTTEYRAWTQSIHDLLDDREDEIRAFSDSFIPEEHCLSISILHLLPHKKLYTQTGKISRRSNDLTNIEKTLVDALYDSRFFKRGFSTLNLDDTFNVNLHSFKRLSPDDSYQINVVIQRLPIEESRSIPLSIEEL